MEVEKLVTVGKILVPIERSEYREKILAHAVALGKVWGAEIMAVHVIDPGRGVPGDKVREKEVEREEQAKREGKLVLDSIDPIVKEHEVIIKKELLEKKDSTAKAIIRCAKENKFDVIVIGTKGTTAVEEFFLGSVANNVIHHAHCPVFAIR